jgi:predicted MFS family arabinose efflux permease
MVLLAAAEFLATLGVTTFQIQQVSLRQAVTPHHLQGRVNATMRLLIDGGAPLGALLGGALGEAVGLRMTLVLGAVGMLLAVPWIVMSPLRSLRELPESADAGA